MEEKEILSPYDNFIYALKAKTTKRQYPNRLDRFLSFIGLVGSIQENRTDFFSIRLWDQGEIINEIIECYDRFDSETKTELPLKRIWTLVEEELE